LTDYHDDLIFLLDYCLSERGQALIFAPERPPSLRFSPLYPHLPQRSEKEELTVDGQRSDVMIVMNVVIDVMSTKSDFLGKMERFRDVFVLDRIERYSERIWERHERESKTNESYRPEIHFPLLLSISRSSH